MVSSLRSLRGQAAKCAGVAWPDTTGTGEDCGQVESKSQFKASSVLQLPAVGGTVGPELPEFPIFQEKLESQIFVLHLSVLNIASDLL